jgi:hypothetical protein
MYLCHAVVANSPCLEMQARGLWVETGHCEIGHCFCHNPHQLVDSAHSLGHKYHLDSISLFILESLDSYI